MPEAAWWGPLDGPHSGPSGSQGSRQGTGQPPGHRADASSGAGPQPSWWGPLDGPCPDGPAPSAEPAGGCRPPRGEPGAGGTAASARAQLSERPSSAGVPRGEPSRGGAAAELQEACGLERRLAQLRADVARRDALLALLPVEAAAGEHDGYVEVPGMDVLPPDQQGNEDGYSMPMMALDACKRACAMDGPAAGVPFGAFVVHGGFVWFRPQPVGECRRHLVSSPGCTTFLNYGPEAARLCGRIRRGLARRRQLRAEAGALSGGEQVLAADGELRRKAAVAVQLQERVCGLEAELQEEVEKQGALIAATQRSLQEALNAMGAGEELPTSADRAP